MGETRKMHLIWMCRDAGLLEFFLDSGIALADDSYTFIFYTGKRELCFKRELPYNAFLLRGRPDLDSMIVQFINSIERDGAPSLAKHQELQSTSQDIEGQDVVEQQFFAEITRLLLTYSVDELFNAAARRSQLNCRIVSFEGLRALIEDVFVRKFSDEQLKLLFDKADADGSGTIEFSEFRDFIRHLEDAKNSLDIVRAKTRPKLDLEQLGLSSGSLKSDEKILNPKNWQMMYCCGAAPVVKALQRVSKKNKVSLSLESFDW